MKVSCKPNNVFDIIYPKFEHKKDQKGDNNKVENKLKYFTKIIRNQNVKLSKSVFVATSFWQQEYIIKVKGFTIKKLLYGMH